MTPAEPHGFEHLCGWIDGPERHEVAASIPTLKQAGPGLAADRSKSVLLYKCWSLVFSGDPDYPPQQIGDCESFGNGHAHDLLQTIEAYLGQLPAESIHRTCTEALYGMGREAGNMLGWSDGCYGAAMAKAMTEMGLVSYEQVGQLGYETTYSGHRAKQWGLHGAPDNVKQAAAKCKLGGAALISTTDEAIAALQAGKPIAISTAIGFTMTRDKDGFCRRKGRWGHCMFIAGYRADKAGFLDVQSWGPQTPDGPTALDQPTFSFWISERDMADILAEGDSFALSGTPGFGPKSLPSEITRL